MSNKYTIKRDSSETDQHFMLSAEKKHTLYNVKKNGLLTADDIYVVSDEEVKQAHAPNMVILLYFQNN